MEQKERAKLVWFQLRERWLALSIPTTRSGASFCRCRIRPRQSRPFRNPAEKLQSTPELKPKISTQRAQRTQRKTNAGGKHLYGILRTRISFSSLSLLCDLCDLCVRALFSTPATTFPQTARETSRAHRRP